MSKWKIVQLSDLVTIKYGKNQKKVQSEKGTIPIYGTGGFMGYAIEALYKKESVLIGRKGTIDKIRYVNSPFWTVDTLFYTIINENKVLPKFLYYNLCTVDFMKMNEGTTIPSLRTETLNKMKLFIPDIQTQKQIASILSALDDKIELNNRINENLESQAQAIFKSWFVDFEPFGGVMPEDWEIGIFSDVADVLSGKRPSMKQNNKTEDVNIPLVGAAAIMGYTNEFNHDDKILVIGRVGTHGIVQRFDYPCWTSDNTLVIKSNYYEYVYQILKLIDYKAMNRGSTQPLITQGDLKKTEIIIPSKECLQKYEDVVNSLMYRYSQNRIENEKLALLRDILLPKLMNSEIDVSEVKI